MKNISIFLTFMMFATHLQAQTIETSKYWHIRNNLDLPDEPVSDVTFLARDYIRIGGSGSVVNVSGTQNFRFGIDESIICEADYQSYVDPSTRTAPDNSLAVGTVTGLADVSPGGAATYAIPIDIPPGTGGMIPSISMVYNSHGGNGVLGDKWSLSGISAITRTGRTKYHDGSVSSVNLTTGDRFQLDGTRIVVGGPISYGAIGQTHYLEVYDYSEIIPRGSAGSGPAYFEVQKRDGTTLYYGNYNGSNAFLKSDDNPTILAWYLARIEDRRGNYIEYKYNRDETIGDTWLTSIEYTGNSNIGLTPYNRVEILYQNKTDSKINYIAGCMFSSSKLVRLIRTYAEGEMVREFVPKYSFNNTTRLNEIEEYTSTGEHYNSTIIGWGEDGISGSYYMGPYVSEDIDKEMYFGFADFNGDGLTDFLKCRRTTDETVNNYEWEVWIADGSTFIKTQDGSWEFSDVHGFHFVPGDYSGDGLSDILVCVDKDLGGESNVYCFQSMGNTLSCSQNNYFEGDNAYRYNQGDLDTDGIPELLNIGFSNLKTYKFTPGDLSVPPVEGTISLNLGNNLNYISYFDGDAKPDVISVGNSNLKVYELTLTGYSEIFTSDEITLSNTSRFYTGNFNGDQNLDILTWNPTEEWRMFINTGSSLLLSTAPPLPNIDMEATPLNNNLFVQDFNSDGRTDVLYTYLSADNSNLEYYLSDGNNWSNISQTGAIGHIYVNKQFIQTYSDFNGDGFQDVFSNVHGDGTVIAHLNNVGDESRLVTDILNGLNMLTSFNYSSIAAPSNNIYTKGTGATFPLFDFQGPLHVVSSLTQSSGSKVLSEISYKYEGAKMHRQGKGFLGFATFSSKDILSGIEISSNTSIKVINGKYYYPFVASTQSKLGATTIATSSVNILLEEYPYGNRFRPYLTRKTEKNYLDDITITTKNNSFDSFGNPTNTTKEFKADDIGTQGHGTIESLITTDIQYWPDQNPYLPDYVKTTSQRAGQPDIERVKTISYTADHLPDVIKKDPNESVEVWEDNDYDPCGNLRERKIMDKEGTVLRKITYTFDIEKRFLIRTTNALGHFVSYVNDPTTGNVLSTTNAQGLTETRTYDGFGRLKTVTDATGATQSVDYAWSDDESVNDDLYYVEQSGADGSYSIEFFDNFGRKVHERSSPAIDAETNTRINYNSKGQVASVSEPYEGATPDHYTYYEYDNFGRQTRLYSYRKDIGYSYPEPRKTVVTNNLVTSHTSWTKKNSMGEVIQAHDPGGDLKYTYNAMGLPIKIEAPGSIMTTMTYDLAGNQLTLTDPSLDSTIYEYDLLGQLTKQTDARGNIYNLEYDDLGRLKTQSNNTEGSNVYTYVPSGNGLGKLQSVSNSTSGITQTYVYDELGSVDLMKEEIENIEYTYDYDYDQYGRLSEMTYPGDAYMIKYDYNQYGTLVGIRNAADNFIWQITDVNALGAAEKIEYGNNLTTDYIYDTYNQLEEIITRNPSAVKKQHLKFTTDYKTGNLLSRSDLMANSGTGITESFIFDDLDRLTDYQVGGHTSITIDYRSDGTGRYNAKSDIGDFHYGENNAPEYALTSITGSDGNAVDLNQQDITYNAFNKVEQIIQNTMEMNIVYGPGQQRKTTELFSAGNPTPVMKKTYIGDLYEIEEDDNGNKRHLYYIPGLAGEAAIFVKENSAPGNLYYIHKDYLGSYQTITDENGNIVVFEGEEQVYSFDPWGRRRNAEDWTYNSVPASFMFNRGYTGHEHLDEFDLINMNGRVFDPATAQFLSPDRYVQSPTSTQSLNRYIYGFNNPLKYNDPSGWMSAVAFSEGGTAFYNLGDYMVYLESISSGNNGTYNVFDEYHRQPDGLGSVTPTHYMGNGVYLTTDQYFDAAWDATRSGNERKFGSLEAAYRAAQWESANGNMYKQRYEAYGYQVSMRTEDGKIRERDVVEGFRLVNTPFDPGVQGYVNSFHRYHKRYWRCNLTHKLNASFQTIGNIYIKDGKANIYVSAYTAASQYNKIVWSGEVFVYDNGELIDSYRLNPTGNVQLPPGGQDVGLVDFLLPQNTSKNVSIRIQVGYSIETGHGFDPVKVGNYTYQVPLYYKGFILE